MIPFSRILKYGNVVESAGLKEYQISADGCMYMLSTTGELYAYGLNQFGMHGTGAINDSTYPFTWKKINSGVSRICTNQSRNLIQIMEDGRVLLSGTNTNDYAFGSLITRTAYTFIDITANLPVPSSTIKYIKPGYSYSAILTNTGEVYWCGENGNYMFGEGFTNNTTTRVYTRSSFVDPNGSQIKDIFFYGFGSTGNDGSILQTYQNKLFGAGSNTYNQMSSGTTPFTAYTAISSAFNYPTVSCGDRAFVLQRDTGALFYCGLAGVVGQYNLFLYSPSGPSSTSKIGSVSFFGRCFTYINNGTRNQYGGRAAGSLPVAPDNSEGVPNNNIWRTIPVGFLNVDLEYFQAGRELTFVYRGDSNNAPKLYALGTLVGQQATSNSTFKEVILPRALGGPG